MNVAYIRVSSEDQNEARQLEAMEDKNIDRYFTEKISGKDMNRPQLQEMLSFVREGDTVFVHDFSRLARSTEDLLRIVKELDSKGVHLVSSKESIDTSTPSGKLLLTMLAAIYEFERDCIKERQAEGIAIAKKNGVYKGSKPKEINLKKLEQYKADIEAHRITKVRAAELLGVSRPTLDKLLKAV